MQALTIFEIVEATGGKLISGDNSFRIDNITTDSRTATCKSLFIPLVGEKTDGHKYIQSVFDNGCRAIITHNDIAPTENVCIVKVSDTLRALGDIAAFYKEKYKIPTVSVTGSVGKTTTRDMVHSALNVKYNTLKTKNNYNNDIGVPWTVFSQEKEHEMAVIEMGMNHFGEIERLSEIVKPDAAVITNIGMAHIANLGSQEGIFKAKLEITKLFNEKNTLIVNGDDKFLSTIKASNPPYKVVYFGINNPENDIYAKDIKNKGLEGIEFTVVVDFVEYNVTVSQPGTHNVYNALAAICAGLVFGVRVEDAIKGIANCEYTANRLELLKNNNVEIINDCYNASPDSMRAAIAILPYSTKKRRVAILGDMLEMGEYADKAHFDLGDEIVKNKIDVLITAGENALYIAKRARELGMSNVYSFDTTQEACNFTKEYIKDGDSVLVKASHGMHFENIVNAIMDINF